MTFYKDGQYEMASKTCAAAFVATADPEAGLAAARSEYRLGHDEAALDWLARLQGMPTEASARIVVGAVHERRGDSERAREAYLQAETLFRKAGNEKGMATAFHRLFDLSWQGSRYREALELGVQAVDHATRAHDHTQEVGALEALFNAVYDIGDLEGATYLLDRIGGLLQTEGDRSYRARLLNNRGAILLDTGHAALARPFFEESLRLATDDERKERRSTHLNLVQTALTTGDLPTAGAHLGSAQELVARDGKDTSARAALAYYGSWLRLEEGRPKEAMDLAREALTWDVSDNRRWQLEYRLGRALEAAGAFVAAREAYQRSTHVIEVLRAAVGNDDLKSWLLEERRQPFEALFRLAVTRGQPPEQALELVERTEARALLDAFVESAATEPTSDANTTRSAPRAWSLTDARDRFDSLRAVLPAEGDSSVARLPPVRQLVDKVGAGTALVYFQADGHLWMLRIAQGRITISALGTLRELGALVDRFISRPDDADAAARLGALLLPTGVLPADGQAIRIVPDGALRGVPFAALRVEGRYIVERHPVAYLPTVSALALPPETRAAPRGPAVVIGDPRGDLPGARQEAREVAARLGVAPTLGADATRASLERASHAMLLHIATHTWLAPGGPWLALADQPLNASAVIGMGVRPRLAVLASCSGAMSRGKGYWGSWATAFLASGAHAVVTSLWSVDDAASRDFIVRFYDRGGAAQPVDALARVQRDSIAAGQPPSAWAPFVFVGSERLDEASSKEGL
jgi:tetratricopeptide (TPR) repeat protein